MSTAKTLVVIPSIRTITVPYIQQLLGEEVDLLVVDDADGQVKYTLTEGEEPVSARVAATLLGATILHFSRADITAYLSKHGWEEVLPLIPQKNPSCKNFGLFYAWVNRYERVVLLDDDCDTRVTPGFLDAIPVSAGPGRRAGVNGNLMPGGSGWVNPTALLTDAPFFSRGFPYGARGETQALHTFESNQMNVVLNEGLWSGTPDINGIDKVLWGRRKDLPPNAPGVTLDSRRMTRNVCAAIPHRARLPLSIMNVQIATRIVPLFWQPPDYPLPGGWRIRRHDDVWSSLLLGHCLPDTAIRTVGGPLIWHRKAGDEIAELLSEHPTNLAQVHLEALLDRAAGFTIDALVEAAMQEGYVNSADLLKAAVSEYVLDAARWHTALTRITFGAALS